MTVHTTPLRLTAALVAGCSLAALPRLAPAAERVDSELRAQLDTTALPTELAGHVALDAGDLTGIGGVLSGAEINATRELDIWLQEDRDYFVLYTGATMGLSVEARSGDERPRAFQLTPTTEAGALLVVDHTDPFFYLYGEHSELGAYGYGQSAGGHIPFVPDLPYEGLDMFEDGHTIETARFPVGNDFIQALEIEGTRVLHQPRIADIDFTDPLNSPYAYRMGINGHARFDVSVLGVGMFEFDAAHATLTADVGLQRQHLAMQTLIEPDFAALPDWVPFKPETRIDGKWRVDGSGDYHASLEAGFRSTAPAAYIDGSLNIAPDGVTLVGEIGDEADPFALRARLADRSVEAEIDLPAGIDDRIAGAASVAIDDALAEVEGAVESLERATAAYELEVSLRGLRAALPGIVDRVSDGVRQVPGHVRDAVDRAVVKWVRDRWAINVAVDETRLGDELGAVARRQAQDEVDRVLRRLTALKDAARQADDASLRAGLKRALLEVAANRTFSKRVRVGKRLLGRDYTLYDRTHSVRVLDDATADRIRTAASYVDRIPAASAARIDAAQVLQALPTRQALERVRTDLSAGAANFPGIDGVGFDIVDGAYSAWASFGGRRLAVSYNVLDARTLVRDLARTAAKTVAASL